MIEDINNVARNQKDVLCEFKQINLSYKLKIIVEEKPQE
jgi:hypothetical protein